MVKDNYSLRRIASALETAQLKTATGGSTWTPTQVKRVIARLQLPYNVNEVTRGARNAQPLRVDLSNQAPSLASIAGVRCRRLGNRTAFEKGWLHLL